MIPFSLNTTATSSLAYLANSLSSLVLPSRVTSTRKELTLSPSLFSLVSRPRSVKTVFKRSSLTPASSLFFSSSSSLVFVFFFVFVVAFSISTSMTVSMTSNEASKLSSGVHASTHTAIFETSKAASGGPNARYPPFLPPTTTGNPFESFTNPPLFSLKICSALFVSALPSPSSKTI